MFFIDPFPNPFRGAVVTDPWESTAVDVPQIHADVFEQCCKSVEDVSSTGRSVSVLLHGEAGSGKTHLIARMRNHFAVRESSHVFSDQSEVVFVSVRLQSGPRMIWRHIRKRFAEDLLRVLAPDAVAPTQLHRVLLQRLAAHYPTEGCLDFWWEYVAKERFPNLDELESQLNRMFDRLDEESNLGHDLCVVLTNFLVGRHLRDSRAWLRGEVLPESTLNRMGLVAPTEDDDDREQEARDMVMALCRLMGPQIPIVFCFDQVEALQMHPNDMTGLYAFGQMVAAMHDQTNNTALISCIQSSFVDTMRRAIRQADWDRIADEHGVLNPLVWEEAVQLISSRLDECEALTDQRRHEHDSLWPLQSTMINSVIGVAGCTPRRLLAFCAKALQTTVAPAETPDTATNDSYLSQLWSTRFQQAQETKSLANQADTILEHAVPLLIDLTQHGWSPSTDFDKRQFNFAFSNNDGRQIAISICNQVNMNSLLARFKRLKKAIDDDSLLRLVIVRDRRLPISPSAMKAKAMIQELVDQGVNFYSPPAKVLAALEAIRTIISDAKAGDLSHDGQTVDETVVQRWFTSNVPVEIDEVLNVVASGPTVAHETEEAGEEGQAVEPVPQTVRALADLLTDYLVMPIHEAATKIGVSTEKLTNCVKQYPKRFGILNGPPAVVFQASHDADGIA